MNTEWTLVLKHTENEGLNPFERLSSKLKTIFALQTIVWLSKMVMGHGKCGWTKRERESEQKI